MNYVTCNLCSSQVSNKTTTDLIVKAWVECPDCVQKKLKTVNMYKNTIKDLLNCTELNMDNMEPETRISIKKALKFCEW